MGQPGFEQVLKNNKHAFAAAFVAVSLPHIEDNDLAQFVEALFANAGVTTSAAERQTAVGEFGGATTTAT